jgi:hypothetical protein
MIGPPSSFHKRSMSNLLRFVRNTLIAVTMICPLAAIAQVDTLGSDDVRNEIEGTAKTFGVAPSKIVYIGLDSKPISKAAFHQALSTNSKLEWKSDTLIKVVGEKPVASNGMTVRLVAKE